MEWANNSFLLQLHYYIHSGFAYAPSTHSASPFQEKATADAGPHHGLCSRFVLPVKPLMTSAGKKFPLQKKADAKQKKNP